MQNDNNYTTRLRSIDLCPDQPVPVAAETSQSPEDTLAMDLDCQYLTFTGNPLLRDTRIQEVPDHSLENHATSIDVSLANDNESDSDFSIFSPGVNSLQNVNSQSGDSLASYGSNVFRYYLSPPVSNQVEPQSKITCDICERQISIKNFAAHLEIHDPFRNHHTCGTCEKSYLRPRDLTKHRNDKHLLAASNTDRHVCGICGDSFMEHRLLKNHRKAFLCFLF